MLLEVSLYWPPFFSCGLYSFTSPYSPPAIPHSLTQAFIHSFIRASLLLTCLFCCFCCCCSWSCLPPSLSSRLPCSRAETSVFRPKGRYSYILLFFWGVRGRGFGGSGPFVAATCAPLPRYFSFFFCFLFARHLALYWLTKRQTLEIPLYPFLFSPFFYIRIFFSVSARF